MAHSREWEGKVALVTGAASGIGRSTAQAFAQVGTTVVLADLQLQAGESLARELSARGCATTFIPCDVSSPADVHRLMDRIRTLYGQLHFAFNNAGIEGDSANTEHCTVENWDRTININLKGVWLCMREEIPLLRETGGGAIVNCSSIAGQVGFESMPAYVASKHGVIGLTRVAALELATSGIRVNAICPGVIDTPMIERFTGWNSAAYSSLVAGEPMHRAGRPTEIAASVLYLCSEAASFVTGHALVVDGGWLAR